MKRWHIVFFLIVFLCLCTMPISAKADGQTGWVEKEDGSRYYYYDEENYYADITIWIGDYCYRFDETGAVVTGFYIDESGSRHYYYEDGHAESGWIEKDGARYYSDSYGTLLVDTTEYIDGYYYRFYETGVMVVGWYKQTYSYGSFDWYYYDQSGKMHTGWLHLGSLWYYCDTGGRIYRNETSTINGITYRFNESGAMVTGWYKQTYGNDSYDWYYYDKNGAPHKGWLEVGGVWYYCDSYGGIYRNTVQTINGINYRFNDSGAMVTGWYKVSYNSDQYDWFYYDKSGAPHKGWVQSGGKWYYCYSDGCIYRNTTLSAGNYREYRFNDNGAMVTAWFKKSYKDPETGKVYTTWYYYDTNGLSHKGWLKSGNLWYYLGDYGKMYANTWLYINGKASYYFKSSGEMATGWVKINEAVYLNGSKVQAWRWYYFNNDGTPHVGWVKSGNDWYLCNNNGSTAVGRTYYGNNSYYFDKSGVMKKNCWIKEIHNYDYGQSETMWYYYGSTGAGYNGWLKSGGYWYYISDGQMLKNTTIDGYKIDTNGHRI